MGFLTFPDKLKYQYKEGFEMNISDRCCYEFKENPIKEWEKANNKPHKILGLMRAEGGRRATSKCKAFKNGKLSFSPLAVVTKEWEEWFINEYHIELCKLYYPPFNFERTGCKGCPYNIQIQEELDALEKHLPEEKRQCEYLWKPVYDEYRRIGYRLKKEEQLKLL